ncbi:M20 family metallopeptidase [Actinomadura sp. 6N118]|uniref:M20 family metallopeptidase n=1 Tax=Actinomadura sp. 6N118 TaxID=3375151 RepID=UPI0037A0F165
MTDDREFSDLLKLADKDHASVTELTRDLVRIPSRGGIDFYEPVLDRMEAWLAENGLPCRRLTGPGDMTVALVSEVDGASPGPRYVLDACLDTASFGDENGWTHPPTSGEIVDGWMYGRGSADSKVGAAIFAHLMVRLQSITHGSVVLLYDLDEHTGGFGGAKVYFEGPDAPDRVDGVMIGYPGIEHVVVGGRGVLRARVHVHGVAGHSGGSKSTPNAIAKAATLVHELHSVQLPSAVESGFPLPGKLTVTAISAGEGYSVVPDLCTFNVDIRLTPAFDDTSAAELLRSVAGDVDGRWPGTRPTEVEISTRWPPYALAVDSPLRTALLGAAAEAGLSTSAKIAGPSNIGNYLAGLGIPATAGFGVDYVGLHGTDERIRLETVPRIQAAYHQALLTLLRPA